MMNYPRFDDYLVSTLKDAEEARSYLEVALEEYAADGNPEALLLAFERVAQAQDVPLSADKSIHDLPPVGRLIRCFGDWDIDFLCAVSNRPDSSLLTDLFGRYRSQ